MTFRSTDEDFQIVQARSDVRRRSIERFAASTGSEVHCPIVWRLSTLSVRNGVCYYNPEGDESAAYLIRGVSKHDG